MKRPRPPQPSASMYWLILIAAGLFEVCWAVGLKYSEGFSNVRWAAFTVVTLVASMSLLALALRGLPLGTAYAVWTGIGAVGTATLGILLFGEPRAPLRLVFIGLILAGIVGLKLVSGEQPDEKAPRQSAAAPDSSPPDRVRPEPGKAPETRSSHEIVDS